MERKNANKSIEINRKKYNIKNRKGETVAYTIISQNNTTTTLSDENGNVITVPARVTLATSTDYTIKKVNNNSVDLESGDGKIIRGVPACVVLAGEGGGGSTYTAGAGISIDANNEISVANPITSELAFSYDETKAPVVIKPINNGLGFSALDVGSLSNGSFISNIRLGSSAGGHLFPLNDYLDCGSSLHKWYNVYTKSINNGANIAVPTTAGTMAVIGVNTTATLAVADWSSNTQTVTVSGVKADSVVFVSPAPASASDYASAGILCTAQAADSLTFTCTTTPSNAITVNVICF